MDEKNYIYGKNPIYEVLNKAPKRINKIYIQKGIFYDNRLKKIIEAAKNNNILIQQINLQKFKEILGENINFQGVVASVASIEFMELEDFLNIKKDGYKKIVILDSISDPHNFGAIIRTSAAAGFDGILIANHRSCPVSATVEKISSGAINHIPIIKSTTLSGAIDLLKKQDFWLIATAANAKDNYFEIDYTDMNFAVVLGSEGKGISKTILNKADFTIKIESNFESLNVSSAAAVVLYEALRQIRVKEAKFCKNPK